MKRNLYSAGTNNRTPALAPKRKTTMLQKVLHTCLLLLLLIHTGQAQEASKPDFFQDAEAFFQAHVQSGWVDYQAIQQSPAALEQLVDQISAYSLDGLEANHRKAFLINAYNVLVIHAVVRRYPIRSPKEVPGFFEQLLFEVAGQEMTLNALEKEQLLKAHPDARLHLALICGARGCPPMAAFAYRPEQLDQQLEQQSRRAINHPLFIRLEDGKAKISSIFSWYESDFKTEGGVRDFINRYRTETLPEGKFGFYTYDWQLNDLRPPGEARGLASRFLQSNYSTTLLTPGELELKMFNNLYTQRTFDGFETLNSRSTFFSSFIQVLYGYNNDVNLGFDLVVKSNLQNDLASSSPFRALGFGTFQEFSTFSCLNGEQNRSIHSNCIQMQDAGLLDTLQNSDGEFLLTTGRNGLAHFGPKFKFNPLRRILPNLSLQQTLYIPIQNDLDGNYISFTQLFYDKSFGTKYQLFAEVSLWNPIAPEFRSDFFFKLFFSYFPGKRWTVYAMTTIPFEYGAGAKYYLTPHLELEVLYTYYAPIERYVGFNRPETFNIGLRYRR
ncbi:MAG: DUF547 domain-containing protein [Bacteroidota bacterium]